MENRFLFPAPASEQLQPAGEPRLMTLPSEQYQTVVYRLPHAFPAPIETTPRDLTVGRVLWHLTLFGLTAITTVLVGLLLFGSLQSGVIYSLALLAILTAHEMGHYIACRWYGVRATPPYFIPFLIPFPGLIQAGTFGAFIKIKSPIPSRRALFDIGIAGPLAGFIFLLPIAFIAHYYAQPPQASASDAAVIYLQDPLLFKFFQRLLHLPSDLSLNPAMFAVWIGALMTSLNLIPVGQLDGGHVTYSVFGRRGNKIIAITCYLLVIGLAIYGALNSMWNWVVWLILLTFLIRVGHPPVIDEEDTLGTARINVAVIGLQVFILCCMPFPISL
jgi:membrane-associated protease RseP (regulator of RpoE activity)